MIVRVVRRRVVGQLKALICSVSDHRRTTEMEGTGGKQREKPVVLFWFPAFTAQKSVKP